VQKAIRRQSGNTRVGDAVGAASSTLKDTAVVMLKKQPRLAQGHCCLIDSPHMHARLLQNLQGTPGSGVELKTLMPVPPSPLTK
jgi:hypothetical protein